MLIRAKSNREKCRHVDNGHYGFMLKLITDVIKRLTIPALASIDL